MFIQKIKASHSLSAQLIVESFIAHIKHINPRKYTYDWSICIQVTIIKTTLVHLQLIY